MFPWCQILFLFGKYAFLCFRRSVLKKRLGPKPLSTSGGAPAKYIKGIPWTLVYSKDSKQYVIYSCFFTVPRCILNWKPNTPLKASFSTGGHCYKKKANNTPLSTPFQPMEVALHSCQLRTCEGVGRLQNRVYREKALNTYSSSTFFLCSKAIHEERLAQESTQHCHTNVLKASL